MSNHSNTSIFEPCLPNQNAARNSNAVVWGRLYGDAFALALANSASKHDGLVVVLCQDSVFASQLNYALRFYTGDANIPLHFLPDWETLPYDFFSPHQDIISERLKTLYSLRELNKGILIIPIQTALARLAPQDYIYARSLFIKNGGTLNLEEFRSQLVQAGYSFVSTVLEHGEFTVRGSLIDLFPMGGKHPYRIELFDDEIESIRIFDPETQRTINRVDEITILPAHEFPLDEDGIRSFRQNYRNHFEGNPQDSVIYKEVSNATAPQGIEYYLPLFFEQTSTLFDYIPNNSLLVTSTDAIKSVDAHWNDINERYEQYRHNIERPILTPDTLFLSSDEFKDCLSNNPQVVWQNFEIENNACNYNCHSPVNVRLDPRGDEAAKTLNTFLMNYRGRVLFTAETTGRKESLRALLKDNDIRPTAYAGWHEFINATDKIGITVAPLDYGLKLDDPELVVITESQLFGQQVLQRRRRKKSNSDPDTYIRNLAELTLGSPVVHDEYGVGRFLGLKTIEAAGEKAEYLTLIYSGDDKLYVPVSSLHLISRYTGASPDNAPLHKLGSGQWEKAKRKAKQRIYDVAAELLEIHAKREAKVGFKYPMDEIQYRAFQAEFPFEETPDQESAIENIINSMCSPKSMDHLVCGDVGFGKTEVAMRAAFIAVMAGKQVAVLAPTTLLTQQHLETFRDRFANWPVKIESLSRFRTKKEQSVVIDELHTGKLDIVIGTHKLLSKEIKFERLGLVIIDEEHRFGVRQKERFKSLRAEVDLLTLTATPIPRTLNFAMSGLRDLSIIATPPAKRLAIKTFVLQWSNQVLIEACVRELRRGGQIYYVHNDVESIERETKKIQALLPEAKIDFAHGQLRERELERKMSDFYHQRFNILVCSTIIETGIDIPNANTIIINRADRFGLAQLYQLRGRVGRSHHRAYAYLVIPDKKLITADAKKRLEAIESIDTLGTGFTLATHDLEIRGAGEILGDEQSGQMHEIGFSMYTELLEKAVKALRSGETLSIDDTDSGYAEIELHIPAIIPEDYLADVHERLILYKRIAGTRTDVELDDLQVEMIDRFGLLPEATKNLVRLNQLKRKAELLGVSKIDLGERGGHLKFGKKPNINHTYLLKLIQFESKYYKLEQNDKLRISQNIEDGAERMDFISQLLDNLLNKD